MSYFYLAYPSIFLYCHTLDFTLHLALSPSCTCLHIWQTTGSTDFYLQLLSRWYPNVFRSFLGLPERFFATSPLVFLFPESGSHLDEFLVGHVFGRRRTRPAILNLLSVTISCILCDCARRTTSSFMTWSR